MLRIVAKVRKIRKKEIYVSGESDHTAEIA